VSEWFTAALSSVKVAKSSLFRQLTQQPVTEVEHFSEKSRENWKTSDFSSPWRRTLSASGAEPLRLQSQFILESNTLYRMTIDRAFKWLRHFFGPTVDETDHNRLTNKKKILLSHIQVTDLGPTEVSSTEQVLRNMLLRNQFLIQCTGAELFVKNLGHAHKADEYTATRLRRGGHNKSEVQGVLGSCILCDVSNCTSSYTDDMHTIDELYTAQSITSF
jgi:hypothetical protein